MATIRRANLPTVARGLSNKQHVAYDPSGVDRRVITVMTHVGLGPDNTGALVNGLIVYRDMRELQTVRVGEAADTNANIFNTPEERAMFIVVGLTKGVEDRHRETMVTSVRIGAGHLMGAANAAAHAAGAGGLIIPRPPHEGPRMSLGVTTVGDLVIANGLRRHFSIGNEVYAVLLDQDAINELAHPVAGAPKIDARTERQIYPGAWPITLVDYIETFQDPAAPAALTRCPVAYVGNVLSFSTAHNGYTDFTINVPGYHMPLPVLA